VQIDLDGSRTLVKWSTGEQTAIASAKVHRKPASKRGYRVIGVESSNAAEIASTTTTDVDQAQAATA
jgi:hypothetical protein